MLRLFILILLLTQTVNASASSTYQPREGFSKAGYVEVMRVSAGGEPLVQILRAFKGNKSSFTLRVLAPLSAEAEREITAFYKQKMPSEFEAALKSQGNLHNPALQPIKETFLQALASTSLYQEWQLALAQNGLAVSAVEFEKLTFEGGVPFVAEITLKCKGT